MYTEAQARIEYTVYYASGECWRENHITLLQQVPQTADLSRQNKASFEPIAQLSQSVLATNNDLKAHKSNRNSIGLGIALARCHYSAYHMAKVLLNIISHSYRSLPISIINNQSLAHQIPSVN